MPEWSVLLGFSAIVLGFVFIPGPATMLTMARATSSGTRVGLATGAGVAVGDIVHTGLAIVGISAVVATSAVLFSVIKYAGAAYLVYLGLCAMFAGGSDAGGNGRLRITGAQAFRQAVLAEVLNPKTALFFLAFLPQFVDPASGQVAVQLAVLGAVFVALGLLATVVFAVFAGQLGHLLRRNRAVTRWQGRVVGAIYCGLGARLAFQEA